MTKTHSTKQAAKLAGVHWITLQRWVAEGKVEPSQRIKLNGNEVWLWTPTGVDEIRRYKAVNYWKGRGGYQVRKRGGRK